MQSARPSTAPLAAAIFLCCITLAAGVTEITGWGPNPALEISIPGEYRLAPTSGTLTAPMNAVGIVITADNVVFDGAGATIDCSTCSGPAINATGVDNVQIKNVKMGIYPLPATVLFSDANNVEFTGNIIYGTINITSATTAGVRDNALIGVLKTYGLNGGVISNNTIGFSRLSIDYGTAVALDKTRATTFANNSITNEPDTGVSVSDGTSSDNVFERNAISIRYVQTSIAFDVGGGPGNIYRENNVSAGKCFSITSPAVLERNSCDSNDVGLWIMGSAGGTVLTGNTVSAKTNAISFTNPFITAKNNIFASREGHAFSGIASNWDGDYNLYYRPTGPLIYDGATAYPDLNSFQLAHPGKDANSVEGNPLFLSLAGNDFWLTAGSPAIDNGTGIAGMHCLPQAQTPGCVTYHGANPDIGAFESYPQPEAPVITPTATPTPSPSPSPSPSASPSPSPSPSPTPGDCTMTAPPGDGLYKLCENGTALTTNGLRVKVYAVIASGIRIEAWNGSVRLNPPIELTVERGKMLLAHGRIQVQLVEYSNSAPKWGNVAVNSIKVPGSGPAGATPTPLVLPNNLPSITPSNTAQTADATESAPQPSADIWKLLPAQMNQDEADQMQDELNEYQRLKNEGKDNEALSLLKRIEQQMASSRSRSQQDALTQTIYIGTIAALGLFALGYLAFRKAKTPIPTQKEIQAKAIQRLGEIQSEKTKLMKQFMKREIDYASYTRIMNSLDKEILEIQVKNSGHEV